VTCSSANAGANIKEESLNRQVVRNLLNGHELKCTMDDGRTATGVLVCIDRLQNIILSNVVEERTVDSSMYETAKTPGQVITIKRRLSQAMIPGPHLVKVEVTKAVYDAAICKVSPVIDAFQ